MPANDVLSYSIGLDPVTIIVVCAFAAAVLILAVLAIAILIKQKNLLSQIEYTLSRQGAPAQSAPPAPDSCPKCGAAHAPGAGFCQNCGAAL